MKILSIFGTRPEAYKMIPLILEMQKHPNIQSEVCITAQHRELVDNALALFNIMPDYDLNIMTVGQTITEITVRVLQGLPAILEKSKPDIILVHGDPTTAFAASLAAFYAKIPIGHVEAGLRSHDKYSPYPEEMNRKLTTALVDFYFAPTDVSRDNLLKEGIAKDLIFVTGNTILDIIKYTTKENYKFQMDRLNHDVDFTKRIILMTAHRGENRGEPMENICRAVLRIVKDNPDTFLVWPVHPGKAVTEPANRILGGQERVLLTQPLDIIDMHNLMSRSYLLLTDSGGLQEESPSFNLPTVVLREVTERPEGQKAGTLVLAGTHEDSIYNEAMGLLTDTQVYKKMANAQNPFGDGNASCRIIDAILRSAKL
ncbi:MAG: UDP-N-acetylglucosamine 2-epimerase (non-hydrolyzing) [Defluviitaleaceae bacterium]|nr:UDP-N-acetylglucosamine 2-epimerase (non-hydrolyzing) [Defluviitaleaceae bacterium]